MIRNTDTGNADIFSGSFLPIYLISKEASLSAHSFVSWYQYSYHIGNAYISGFFLYWHSLSSRHSLLYGYSLLYRPSIPSIRTMKNTYKAFLIYHMGNSSLYWRSLLYRHFLSSRHSLSYRHSLSCRHSLSYRHSSRVPCRARSSLYFTYILLLEPSVSSRSRTTVTST